ncbi:MerR family transcriptional regulator [Sinomonas sp. ASV486]|uniref:MerR family transcriptional regulator n=1 Tax=Sinomonas puerhi TaxID=3238584 RepID=A0AB39L0H7_9MICC|nr:MerR family transcriptional regulator [Sinomonas sp. ASV486]MDQ4488866.1 MerR family transcriptional regulator [Sinomonas sp. ASV486]
MGRARRSSEGVYAISVAAELSGMALSSLRLYERRGLLTPSRTDRGTRRYSEDDVERLERIAGLVGAGLTIEGIRIILELEDENARLRRELARLRSGTGQG